MRGQAIRSGVDVDIEYTTKPVSGWGGFAVLGRFMNKLGVRELLKRALPDGRKSNNLVPVVDMVMGFVALVLSGGSRFAHIERLRDDEVVARALGITRSPSPTSVIRYFSHFTRKQVEHMSDVLAELTASYLSQHVKKDILDMDSTVFLRHGKQEGSTKGYNPEQPGGVSHHPLIAMFARTKLIAYYWLRAGSAAPKRGCVPFMQELLAKLPKDFTVELLRADSGFYNRELFELMEERGIPYLIAAMMTKSLRLFCAEQQDFIQSSRTVAVASAEYRSSKWSTARRMIIVRKTKGKSGSGQAALFENEHYEYQAFITSLTEKDPIKVWRLYLGRGDCENRIKELKYDFHIDEFCLRSFEGTETATRLIVFAANLVTMFRARILRDTKVQLATLRSKLFVIGAIVGRAARKVVLRIALTRPWRDEFDKLLRRINLYSISTAAQSDSTVETPPSPWTYRRVKLAQSTSY